MAALLRAFVELSSRRFHLGFAWRRGRLLRVGRTFHLVHERVGRALDVAHRFAQLARELRQLFGSEQQQREQKDDGGVGRTEHTLRPYFPVLVGVIFFGSPKIVRS